MNELTINLFKMSSAIVFLLLIYFAVEFLIRRHTHDAKRSVKLRVLLRYILFGCFVFFMAKIWVEGFGFLLTVIGVVAAALTITQKEYLMNFFGWSIIMWRDLFVEGDYIEIGKYCGYVTQIGPLYFSIEEASDSFWGDKTGKIIKIPNSLIATNPIANFSTETHLGERKICFTFTFDSSLEKIRNLIPILEEEMAKILARESQNGKKLKFLLRVQQEKPCGIELKIKYYALKRHQNAVEDKLFEIITDFVNVHEDVKFAVVM